MALATWYVISIVKYIDIVLEKDICLIKLLFFRFKLFRISSDLT